ncbi:MAG: 6-bladed beta-propeller [Tannerella sp.]|jgi:hypothetical protein|nr:6-bladed beta-propeller [Tannerella sp.]
MKKTQLFFLAASAALLCLGGCGTKSNGIPAIPMDKAVGKIQPLSLSRIAASVEYVPLETNDSSLVPSRRLCDIQAADDYFFLNCRRSLLEFSRKGKFIRQIGRQGKGPGEFVALGSILADGQRQALYMLNGSKVLVYSFDGTFKKEINLDTKEMPCQLSLFKGETLAVYVNNFSGQEANRLLLFDRDGHLLKQFPQYERFQMSGMQIFYNNRYIYPFQGNTYMKEDYNDTVFQVTADKLLPHYLLQLGKYQMPLGKLAGGDFLRPLVMETTHYVFLPYTKWQATKDDKPGLCLYDKPSGKCFEVEGGRIKNDLEADGLPFKLTTTIDDNTLLGVWNAADIADYVTEHPALKARWGNISPEANPVLMIVHLK